MDVLNKIINQNFDITLSDADLMNIVEFWKIIGDFKQKCFYIRTIIEAINNKIIDPDTFLTVSISNCQSFDDLLLVSIALRYGANPNLYVVMNGVVSCATAIALPDGEKATPMPMPVGSVAGLANFTPKPLLDQG